MPRVTATRAGGAQAGGPGSLAPRRVVVFVSGAGTLLQALLDDAASGPESGYRIAGVVSDRDDALGLDRARAAGVPTAVVSLKDFSDRLSWDEGIARAVDVFNPQLVVLAGFMRLLGKPYLAKYGDRTINTHPALLPAFPGAHAVRDAVAHGVKVTGCSVIFVDEGTDSGPIIAQRAVDVDPDDDESSLHERIKVAERELLVDVVGRLARSGWSVENRKVTIG